MRSMQGIIRQAIKHKIVDLERSKNVKTDIDSKKWEKEGLGEEEVRMRNLPGTDVGTPPDAIADAPTAAAPCAPFVTFEALVLTN